MKSLYWKLPPRSFMVERCQCLLSTLQRTGWLSFRGYCNRWLKSWNQSSLPLWKPFSSVQSLSWCPTLRDPMNCSMPGLPVHHQLPEFTQTHVHRVGDATQPSHPLSSPSPPAPNPSQHQGLFQWVNSSHEVAKVLEFQLHHQSFNEHPRLISLRMDWLDLLAVQGTLKSLLQHHSSKASILRHSTFFSPTLTSIHDHWKNHSLD